MIREVNSYQHVDVCKIHVFKKIFVIVLTCVLKEKRYFSIQDPKLLHKKSVKITGGFYLIKIRVLWLRYLFISVFFSYSSLNGFNFTYYHKGHFYIIVKGCYDIWFI